MYKPPIPIAPEVAVDVIRTMLVYMARNEIPVTEDNIDRYIQELEDDFQ